MSKQHTPTPTPWRLGGISGRMIESKGHYGFIADIDLKVIAEFIVKSVNNHDRLVEENVKMKTLFNFLLRKNMCSTSAAMHINYLLTELK